MKAPRDSKSHNLDMTKPIDKKALLSNTIDEDCFGKEWDVATKECGNCADSEICCILFADTVNSKVAAVQEKYPLFLDNADFSKLNADPMTFLENSVSSGVTTSAELIGKVMDAAQTSDEIAAIEFVKRMATTEKLIKIKDSIVYLKF